MATEQQISENQVLESQQETQLDQIQLQETQLEQMQLQETQQKKPTNIQIAGVIGFNVLVATGVVLTHAATLPFVIGYWSTNIAITCYEHKYGRIQWF
jgi:amino acid permease